MTFIEPKRLLLTATMALLLLPLPFAPAHAQTQAQPQAQGMAPSAPTEVKDFSPAERLLFMSNHLAALTPPMTLRYSFRKSGSLEEGFEDKVSVVLAKRADGACCASVGEFLTGARRLNLPELPAAEGNPVILYFLEYDVREMQRLTKGSQFHFRKRIRMAVYQGATLRDVSLAYRGKTVKGTEIEISPYLDDPNRPRFEKLARKQYVFTLSEAVPGGVYAIRTQVGDAAQAAPLIVEELTVDGAEPAPPKAKP
jgi:hypothetical protein